MAGTRGGRGGSARPARTAAAARAPSRLAPALEEPPGSAARQGCARRRGPGSPPRGRRSGGVRDMLAEERGGRGFCLGPLRQDPLLFPRALLGTGASVSPPSSRGLQQLPHGFSLVRWARDRLAGAPPPRPPGPGARPARRQPPARARAPASPAATRSVVRTAGRPSAGKRAGDPSRRSVPRLGRARPRPPEDPPGLGETGGVLFGRKGASPPSWDPRRAGSLWGKSRTPGRLTTRGVRKEDVYSQGECLVEKPS